jgi:CRISPR system Cascade subunit CasC
VSKVDIEQDEVMKDRKETMLIELHMIQNFAPSNLNRDDTGAPKDCDFGGVRRARISSQCFKRAIREEFKRESLLPEDRRLLSPEELAYRTKILVSKVVDCLADQGKDRGQAQAAIEAALRGAGLRVDQGKAEYLLYLGSTAISRIAEVCTQHWDALTAEAQEPEKKETAKTKKKDAKAAAPKEVKEEVLKILDSARAADLALFGRMLADLPEKNIDAASQVAHAISTHKVAMEFDFYTAVDDLQARAETGAGMMGTVEYNSACFYRYANVDVYQLKTNLGGDEDLARRTIEAFLRASKDAIPTGKQNSFAAHNPPAFILAVVRDKGAPVSLANAFEKPVRTGRDDGLVEPSIEELDKYWGEFTAIYGKNGIRAIAASRMGDKPELKSLQATSGFHLVSFDKLVETIMGAIEFAKEVQS